MTLDRRRLIGTGGGRLPSGVLNGFAWECLFKVDNMFCKRLSTQPNGLCGVDGCQGVFLVWPYSHVDYEVSAVRRAIQKRVFPAPLKLPPGK
jgi:hypothetical protein